MDAVTLLRNDHKPVEGLFKKFEKAGPNAHKTKQDLVEKIVEELSIHAAIEEQVLYPAARQAVPDATDAVLEALEELAQALEQAKKMAPTHPHPRAPDTPPGNVIAGVAAGAVDRAQDTGKKTVRRVFGRSRNRERKAG